jgi:hypothetical protein
LRDIQSSKKNSYIENAIIENIRDVLDFNRHLFSKDIETLVISRIIGCDIFEYKSIPLYFSSLLDGLSVDDKKDIIQDCNSNLSRAFFNKNSNRIFWNICEGLITFLEINDNTDVDEIFNITIEPYSPKLSYLTPITIKYLIAIIIEGKE